MALVADLHGAAGGRDLALDLDRGWVGCAHLGTGHGGDERARRNGDLDRVVLTRGTLAAAVDHDIAGGVGFRLKDHLPQSGFRDRFIAKGRFERRMDEMPVRLITHPQPGLYGAAAAFAEEHRA